MKRMVIILHTIMTPDVESLGHFAGENMIHVCLFFCSSTTVALFNECLVVRMHNFPHWVHSDVAIYCLMISSVHLSTVSCHYMLHYFLSIVYCISALRHLLHLIWPTPTTVNLANNWQV